MVIKLSSRLVFSAIALICMALLATAYQLQYGAQQQQPCPLCILQRYAYIGIALVAIIGAMHGPGRTGGQIYNTAIASIASIGAGFAIWLLNKPVIASGCLSDPVGEFVNGLASANWWPEFFFATGACGTPYPPILGISVAVWSLIWFGFFAAFSTTMVVKAARRKKS